VKARPGLSAKRIVATTVAGVTAVSLLGACGFETRQQAAAVVNGHVISESEVKETADQLKAAKLEFPENIVVTALIAAPFLTDAVERSGSWKPDETYASAVAAIPGATETTKEFISAVAIINSQKMTPNDVAAYRDGLNKAKITVNPKYGHVVPSPQGPVYFSLGVSDPNWVKPLTAASSK
jgi:hypothetical protein